MNKASFPYLILPFRFERTPEHDLLLVNEVGEFMFLNSPNFEDFVSYRIDTDSQAFLDLKGKHFATDTDLVPIIELLATKYRTKKSFLRNSTALHMMVITVRCNHCCKYCHASSEHPEHTDWDMTPSIAKRVVDMVFMTPSPVVKIEFQGGEPLLNWKTIQETVEYAEDVNKKAKKQLEFVLCTNLSLMDEDILSFMKNHNILVSTSLDGPKDLHDKNRILRKGGSSYEVSVKKLTLTRKILGEDRVSALMTTSKENLDRMTDVVDEYVKQGFRGIFLRALNPYGFAKRDCQVLGYSIEDFVESYKKTLRYIIDLNLGGTYFEEYYTTLLLSRILTPFSTGFMDLQSPSGAGLCGVMYDYNGDVYPSDEGRMLAKMGDKKFLMGNVTKGEYVDIFTGHRFRSMVNKSCVEILPGCSWCAFQPYCGADPVRNYSEQGDIIGHRPTSEFCNKHKDIMKFLFGLIRVNADDVMDVFWSWITRRPLKEIRSAEFTGAST